MFIFICCWGSGFSFFFFIMSAFPDRWNQRITRDLCPRQQQQQQHSSPIYINSSFTATATATTFFTNLYQQLIHCYSNNFFSPIYINSSLTYWRMISKIYRKHKFYRWHYYHQLIIIDVYLYITTTLLAGCST